MEVERLRDVNSNTIGCSLLRPNACPCIINPRDGFPELNDIRKFNRELQEHLAKLPEKYTKREDFAAVSQPFFRNTVLPTDENGEPDVDFFSKDCFHFHERGHAAMAIALWNNMLEPENEKSNSNSNYTHDRNKLKCPTSDHPFLFTLKNSRRPQDTPDPEVEAEKDGNQVPYWAVIVASVGGVLLGCMVVGIAMSASYKRRLRNQNRQTVGGGGGGTVF